MELRHVRLSDPLIAALLAGLADEYEARYGANNEMAFAHPGEFDPPSGLFLALVDGADLIAGGGFRYLGPGVCEVKYASRHYRRIPAYGRYPRALAFELTLVGEGRQEDASWSQAR